jgi:hypothetical protein
VSVDWKEKQKTPGEMVMSQVDRSVRAGSSRSRCPESTYPSPVLLSTTRYHPHQRGMSLFTGQQHLKWAPSHHRPLGGRPTNRRGARSPKVAALQGPKRRARILESGPDPGVPCRSLPKRGDPWSIDWRSDWIGDMGWWMTSLGRRMGGGYYTLGDRFDLIEKRQLR